MQQIEQNQRWLGTLSERPMSDQILRSAASPPASTVLVQSLNVGRSACLRDQHTKSIVKSFNETIQILPTR